MENLQIAKINQEITQQLSDKQTELALITTTFKGLSAPLMRQAIFEAMLRGFTFKDFLQKDVYAIPFNKGTEYSIVTSIDYMRKIAAQNGLAGKNAPEYEEEENGQIKTCSVTVKRIVNGILGEYTAKVYFKEYSTGNNLWVKKPHTMIAKVAEMHALRMAFPEELSKAYIEDEMNGGTNTVINNAIADSVTIDTINAAQSIDELRALWMAVRSPSKELVDAKNKRKEELLSVVSVAKDEPIPTINSEADVIKIKKTI